MSTDIDNVARQLERERLVDRGGLLRGNGPREILAAIDKWEQQGLRARVLVLPLGEPLEPWHALVQSMSLQPRRDLLLLFNGRRIEALGWGLPPARVARVLADVRGEYHARRIVAALDALGAAATGGVAPAPRAPAREQPAARERSSGFPLIGGGLALLAVGGLVAWVIRRRMRLAGAGDHKEFESARVAAERAYADLILAAEELPKDEGARLQLQAADVKKRLDAVTDEASSQPRLLEDPVTVGRIRQFESELCALRSTLLQKEKLRLRGPDAQS